VDDWRASIERMVTSQQEQITSQQQEITALRRELAVRRAARPRAVDATRGDCATNAGGGRRASRRDLLKLGGAAAAATVAGVLAAEHGTAHAAPTHADGVTLLETASGSGNVAIEGDGFSGAQGVIGTSDSSSGVQGGSGTSNGVYGTSNESYGVYGLSFDYVGVAGRSDNFVGVQGVGYGTNGVGGWFSGIRANLNLGAASVPGAPTANMHWLGDVYLDSNGVLWVCVGTGTPGTWVRLTGVANGTVGGSMNFLPGIARLVTSGNPSDPGVPLAVGTPVSFQLAPLHGIPANATGVFGNATVYGASGTGFVSVFPYGGSATGGSLNFTAGDEPLSNFVATGMGSGGGSGGVITVATFASGCKFIYDAVGYTL
jgi:hypothetical protein